MIVFLTYAVIVISLVSDPCLPPPWQDHLHILVLSICKYLVIEVGCPIHYTIGEVIVPLPGVNLYQLSL